MEVQGSRGQEPANQSQDRLFHELCSCLLSSIFWPLGALEAAGGHLMEASQTQT